MTGIHVVYLLLYNLYNNILIPSAVAQVLVDNTLRFVNVWYKCNIGIQINKNGYVLFRNNNKSIIYGNKFYRLKLHNVFTKSFKNVEKSKIRHNRLNHIHLDTNLENKNYQKVLRISICLNYTHNTYRF